MRHSHFLTHREFLLNKVLKNLSIKLVENKHKSGNYTVPFDKRSDLTVEVGKVNSLNELPIKITQGIHNYTFKVPTYHIEIIKKTQEFWNSKKGN